MKNSLNSRITESKFPIGFATIEGTNQHETTTQRHPRKSRLIKLSLNFSQWELGPSESLESQRINWETKFQVDSRPCYLQITCSAAVVSKRRHERLEFEEVNGACACVRVLGLVWRECSGHTGYTECQAASCVGAATLTTWKTGDGGGKYSK